MFLVVFTVTLLAICNGDVSHLDTDLREDGYHYKQPSQPFPSDNNGLENNIENLSQSGSPFKPKGLTPEYLPPGLNQQEPQPSPFPRPGPQTGRTSTTFVPESEPQKINEYGPPPTFAPQPPQSPRSTYSPRSQPTPTRPNLSPSPRPVKPTNDYRAAPTFAPRPNFPSSPAPEREYLPPGSNQIVSEKTAKPAYPFPSKTSPELEPTYPAPGQPTYSSPTLTNTGPASTYPVPQPTYPGPQSTYQTPQSGYSDNQPANPEPSETYTSAQPTYPGPQPTSYNRLKPETPTLPAPAPQPEEVEPAHVFGPDGYKYKVPSKSFKY